MKIKVLGATLLGSILLFGCAMTGSDVPWEKAQATTEVEQTTVTLESNVWGNKMPTFDQTHLMPLQGTLILTSDKAIPSDLAVASIWIRHDSEILKVAKDAFDVEAVNEGQWKISFKQDDHFEGALSVADVAIELKSDTQNIWLVEKSIKIDIVH
ncbi:hypothetical protein [Vibrio rarus]|uniref:hypothetical protein n=1 Tax=Vibrio rarus TaxID=413403 RepID=UPI0021C26ED8|nr:hypothetical protein [Vibrio rarus]